MIMCGICNQLEELRINKSKLTNWFLLRILIKSR